MKWFLKIMGPQQVNCSNTPESKNKEKNIKNWKKWLKQQNLGISGWTPSLVMGLVRTTFVYVPTKIQLNQS